MAQNFDLGTDYSKEYLNKMYSGTLGNANVDKAKEALSTYSDAQQKKLVSSYYDQQKKPEGIRIKSPENNSISRNYKTVQSAATSLKNSARELSKESPIGIESVASFADNYNKTIDTFNTTNNASLRKKGEYMTRFTAANSGMLSKVGIEIGADNKLTVDRDKLSKADEGDLKSLFNGNNSFGQSIAERAGQIEGMSRNTVNKISKMYDGAGQYKTAFNPESIINNYF
ncbi:MAG: hypothetical protein IK152_05235 [Lachnospiraceae bacterium]|nr:hypothetical protein [Lachnospiraceae bacterium]